MADASAFADLPDLIDSLAAGIDGVVRVDVGDDVAFERAYGRADRAHDIAMTPDHQLALASGSKAFTALAVMTLIADGVLELSTPARHLLGDDLPLIAADVTVEHLLSHRSGIGDYLDEEGDGEFSDYVMPVPVHQLATTEDFLAVLDGFPTKFPAGERFSYCNGGYMVLALIAERASGIAFHDLVQRRVLDPAGMGDTAYLRSDQLPGRAAVGYVDVDGSVRTNIFHLPVRGNGDGGAYSTVADIHRFWRALMAGDIVSPDTVAEMIRPRSVNEAEGERAGMGFALHATTDTVMIEGGDAGVSFNSAHSPGTGITYTVIATTAGVSWPVAKALGARLLPTETPAA